MAVPALDAPVAQQITALENKLKTAAIADKAGNTKAIGPDMGYCRTTGPCGILLPGNCPKSNEWLIG
jgi:hypothetical protein